MIVGNQNAKDRRSSRSNCYVDLSDEPRVGATGLNSVVHPELLNLPPGIGFPRHD